MRNKYIIIFLIRESLRNSRLISGLKEIGYHEDLFRDHLAELYLSLMNIEIEDSIIEIINDFETKIADISVNVFGDKLDDLAEELYEVLKKD